MKTFITFLTENSQHPPHIQEVIDGFHDHFERTTGRKISDCGQLNCAWVTREFGKYIGKNHPNIEAKSIFMANSRNGPDHIAPVVGKHIVDFTRKPGEVHVTSLEDAAHPEGLYHPEGYFQKGGEEATRWMKGGVLKDGIKIGTVDEIEEHMGEPMTIHGPGEEPPSGVPDDIRASFAQNPPKK
jgi:hypothetical protein